MCGFEHASHSSRRFVLRKLFFVFFQPHQIMLFRTYLYSEEFSVQIAVCRNIISLEELVGVRIGCYLLDLGCQKAT